MHDISDACSTKGPTNPTYDRYMKYTIFIHSAVKIIYSVQRTV